MKSLTMITMVLILFALPATAEISPNFSIQGVLTDNSGAPLPDDEYSVTFRFYDAQTSGNLIWSESDGISQDGGVFSYTFYNNYPDTFDEDLWLEITLEGESPMTPRTALTAVPVALRANSVDPTNAVTRLDGLHGNIDLVAGSNVSISHSGNAVTIAASGGSGGDDGDWTISGSNLYHSGTGTVAVGTSSPQPLYAGYGTTMQVSSSFMPNLCLDRTYGGLDRWAFYNSGGGSGLRIGRTEVATDIPVSGMEIFDTKTEFRDENGDVKIQLKAADSMEMGSTMSMFSTSSFTTLPTVSLKSQENTNYGGVITLRDGNGNTKVKMTANYNGTGVGRVTTPVLEITGGSDLSEQFDIGNTSLLPQPGMVVSIDPENPGRLSLCNKAYDRRIAGVISGAGGIKTGMLMGQSGSKADGEHPVALIGRVYVWADASNGPIEPGDLLTSGNLPGYAMKVTDHNRASGAILGKAMSGLSEGQGLILTLVSLQ